MTRHRDLMCEDLFECQHKAEIPISSEGMIVEWRCRCGKTVFVPDELDKKSVEPKGES